MARVVGKENRSNVVSTFASQATSSGSLKNGPCLPGRGCKSSHRQSCHCQPCTRDSHSIVSPPFEPENQQLTTRARIGRLHIPASHLGVRTCSVWSFRCDQLHASATCIEDHHYAGQRSRVQHSTAQRVTQCSTALHFDNLSVATVMLGSSGPITKGIGACCIPMD